MGTRKLKITGIHPGVQKLGTDDVEKMDEMHIFFNRQLSRLEFSGIQSAIERAMK